MLEAEQGGTNLQFGLGVSGSAVSHSLKIHPVKLSETVRNFTFTLVAGTLTVRQDEM